jgi:Uma2 family endonuclease
MPAHPQLALQDQMTIEEFLSFTETRPDDERWELIEGVAVLNASPVDYHQVVATNIVAFSMIHKNENNSPWLPLIGIGTRVPASANSLPQPDVQAFQGAPTGRPVTDDGLVIFEVLSRNNTKADQAWRRKVYASIANCQHYVTVSLKSAELIAYDRSTEWKPRTASGLRSSLDLPALKLKLPLKDVYRYTPIGA